MHCYADLSMNVCVTGSAAYDTVFSFSGRFKTQLQQSRLDHLNVCFPAASMTRRFGGCGGNIAYACRLLGEKTVLLSAFGTNDADAYLKHLKKHGVDVVPTLVENAYTAQCVILSDATGSQIATFCPNAALFTRTDLWPEVPVDIGIVSPETRSVMLARVDEFVRRNIPFFFDPGQITPRFTPSELLNCIRLARYTVMSDYELDLVQRMTGLKEDALLDLCPVLIVTQAEQGAHVLKGRESFHVPACPVRAQDTIGAGDAFRAGLLHAVCHNLDWQHALQLGCALASFKVQSNGAQSYSPTRQDIINRLAENYGTTEGYAL